MNEQSQLVDELHQAADSYTPPPVPIDQLLAGGRRRRRRKQGLTIFASAAAAAAAVVIGVVAIPSISQDVQPARGSSVSINDHIRFVLPPGWREIPNQIITGAPGGPTEFWTNQPTPPIGGHPQNSESSCLAPITKLHRNGVLVSVGLDPSWPKDEFRTNATIAGRSASITSVDARTVAPPGSGGAPSCGLGASRILHVAILAGTSPLRGRVMVLSLNAWLGPGNTHRLEQQMRHVLATARPVLAPRQRQAALAAAHRAANGYAATDPQPRRQGWQRNILEVTATVYPTPITDWNVRHYCHTDRLLKVTLRGRFPHISVSPPPGATSTDVHAMDLVVTDAGRTCLSGVRTGDVRRDPSAVVLFKQ